MTTALIEAPADQSCEESSHDYKLDRHIDDDELLKDLSADNVHKYGDGDLIAAVRLHTDTMRDAIQTFCLTNEDRCVLYDELHVRFKAQHVLCEKRNGKPTLRQAFDLAGWDYDKARAWHSYWMRASKDLLKLDVAMKSQLLDVADGDILTVTDDAPKDFDVPRNVDARVKEVSGGGTKVTLVLDTNDGGEKEITTPIYDADGVAIFKKVPAGIRIIDEDDIVRFKKDPDGFAYRCVGVNSFKLDRKTPSLKQLRDDAEKKKKQTAKKTPATRTDIALPTSPDGEAKRRVRKPRKLRAPKRMKEAETPATFMPWVTAVVSDAAGKYACFYADDTLRTTHSATSMLFDKVEDAEAARDKHNKKANPAMPKTETAIEVGEA
jgi:hypothetical protein